MKIPGRLSIVTLGVRDLGRARAFYRALGWEQSSYGSESIAFFKLAGAILALYDRAALAEDAQLDPDTSGAFGGITLAVNVDSAREVDAALGAAVAAGATLLKAPIDASWGGRSGYFADPDGHPWEVAWVPAFPIGADGRPQLP